MTRIDGDGGFGILAPFGTATLGLDVQGVRILGDVRPQYRWQWDADDQAVIFPPASR
jgi:hypothetical protein